MIFFRLTDKFTIAVMLMISGSLSVHAHNGPDSLYSVWQDENQPDSNRASAFSSYILDGFMYSDPDSAYILAEDLVEFSVTRNYPKGEAIGLNLKGVSTDIRGNSSKALGLFRESLEISLEIGDKHRVGIALNNIGIIYEDQGDYLKALDYYEQSLAIYEETGKKDGIARSLGNIGDIYRSNRNLEKALEYYLRCLKMREEIGVSTGSSLKDIGEVYLYKGDHSKALDYFNMALINYEEAGNKRGMAHTLGYISKVCKETGDYPSALEYNARSLELLEETGDQPGMANLLHNNGDLHLKLGNHNIALELCLKAKEIAEGVDHLELQMNACNCLYQVHKSMRDGNTALQYHERMLVFKDSLQLEETAKKLQLMEFEKVMLQDSIDTAEEERLVREAHLMEVSQKNRIRNYLAGTGILLLILAGGFYTRWRYVRRSRDEISREKERSDNLLLNILPAEIADELRENGKAEARDFENVSILFTDFVDFTELSSKLKAKELVSEINTCFKKFDEICEKNSVEKIKTIGDAYMAAGGLPVQSTDSTRNTVRAALEMQEFILNRESENKSKELPFFKMRIGIHTGPVAAGIVGIKKFQYDVWGDTVNTASRMENSSETGKVNISNTTYELLKDYPEFSFESRGRIGAKGKGELEMYFISNKD